jgi:hypothetical protein
MTRALPLVAEHVLCATVLFPQKSAVVWRRRRVSPNLNQSIYFRGHSLTPQNPHLEQHTFSGHLVLLAHCAPYPGSQSDRRPQSATQVSPQTGEGQQRISAEVVPVSDSMLWTHSQGRSHSYPICCNIP